MKLSNPDGSPVTERKPGTKCVYIGETARSVFMRSSEHWDHLQKALTNPDKSQENALAKHAVL